MTKNYIPTINISSLVKNNFETQSALKTIKEIEKACVKVGFFQITGHGLNLKDIKKVCEVGKVIVTSGCPLVVLNALVMAVPDGLTKGCMS